MKVEPSSPIRNSNPFSRSSSGSSLHTGNHSSSSGHGMYYRKIYANINLGIYDKCILIYVCHLFLKYKH